MKVPFIDFSEQYRTIKDEIQLGLNEVFETGSFILGPREKAFEQQFANYCNVKYGVGVNSGTDALFLALLALHVTAGDEIILPTFTFIATALCVSYTGAKPVFVDVEEETYNIDPKLIEKAITKRTKAIIPVHLYGQPANLDEIRQIAAKRGVAVIEDAAQSHGATYKGNKVGSLADIACFSFYPTKSLGAFGDGGIILTNREDIYERTRMLRDYGRKDRYAHSIKGYNSRLDTVQAVILSAKLRYLDEWNRMRNQHALTYCQLLADVEGVITPKIKKDRTHVFQTFAVRVKNRDDALEQMQKKGVGVLIHYPIPLHLQEAYGELGYRKGDFPVAEELADEVLSLPMFPHMNQQQIEYVCESLKETVGAAGRSPVR